MKFSEGVQMSPSAPPELHGTGRQARLIGLGGLVVEEGQPSSSAGPAGMGRRTHKASPLPVAALLSPSVPAQSGTAISSGILSGAENRCCI